MVSFRVKVWVTYYKARKGTELRFRLRLFLVFLGGVEVLCACVTACQKYQFEPGSNVEMLSSTCSCMLSQQISTIVFSNAAVEALLIKLGDSA